VGNYAPGNKPPFAAGFAKIERRESDMPAKSPFLTVSQYRKLRGKQKKPVIVHFNERQWANLTRGLKPVDKRPPKSGVQMILTTLPGLPGGFVEFRCPDGGPITGAEGQSRCGGKPDVDFPTPSTPSSNFPGICFTKLGADGRMSCVGRCRSGNCRKITYGVSLTKQGLRGPVVVVCAC
jgi:hypothetical protein